MPNTDHFWKQNFYTYSYSNNFTSHKKGVKPLSIMSIQQENRGQP